MKRQLKDLRNRIREELRAQGPDGGGYSDPFIDDNIRSAVEALSELYTIRDRFTVGTDEGKNEYDLSKVVEPDIIENIIQVHYGSRQLKYKDLSEYDPNMVDDGMVRAWSLWGNILIIFGDIEGDEDIKLWVTRVPYPPENDTDEIEMPPYADEAIIQYTIAACYRSSKDWEAATQHFNIYMKNREQIRRRSIPQGRRTGSMAIQPEYSEPLRARGRTRRTDTNPGGHPQ